MITAALTGNIGSGKSFVAALLQRMGFPVYPADREAARLMNTPGVTMRIADRFGLKFLTPDGLPDRKKLAALAFADPTALQWLNHTIHPLVMSDWQQWKLQQTDAPIVFMESAIVFENNLQHHFDAIVLVTAPEPVRLERVMKRDGVDAESVKQRMEHQWPEEKKIAMAHHVIVNDEHTLLQPQLVQITETLRKKPV
jgi:dephospho-CoA kinase